MEWTSAAGRCRCYLAGLAAAVALVFAMPSRAVEGTVGFRLGSQYSDNVNLGAAGEEQSAWMAVGTMSLGAGERSERSEIRAGGTLDYVEYFSGPFEDDFVLSMNGSGNWTLSESVRWVAEDHFNQMTVDAMAAPVPTNRQDANVFTTGPEARVPLSRDQILVTGARYENFYFEKSDASSQRLGGYGRWLYAMDPRRDLSANVEASATDFRHRRFPDFRRADAFLRLANRWQRASMELDGGRSFIDRDEGSDVSGVLGRLGWHLPFNCHAGVDFYLRHQYSDVGTEILERRPGAAGPSNVTEQVTGNIFYARQSELAWYWRGSFSTLRLAGSIRDEDYKTADYTRRYEEGGIDYGYELTESLLASADLVYRRAEYSLFEQVNTDRAGILTLTYRINSRMTGNLQVAHTERDSNFAPDAFKENRIFVSVGYNQPADPQRLPGTIADTGSASSPGGPGPWSGTTPGAGTTGGAWPAPGTGPDGTPPGGE